MATNNEIAKVSAEIEKCRQGSANLFEMAIDTADSPEAAAEYEAEAAECNDCYEAAIETLDTAMADYLRNTVQHLEAARRLESGDDQWARRAIAAVQTLTV